MIIVKNFGTFKTQEEFYAFLGSSLEHGQLSMKINYCFMRILRLSRSGIKSLNIEFMPNLKKLIADDNPLSVLKIKAKKLKLLQINRTTIKELKLLTPSLEVLNAQEGIWTESLDLELVNLKRLDVSESWKLRRLDLRASRVEVILAARTHLRKLEGNFPNLLKADFGNTFIDNQTSLLSNVRILHLQGAVVKLFVGDYPNLESLNLNDSRVVKISGSFPSLRRLKCSTTVTLETIEGDFPALEVLKATFGRLSSIPKFLPKLRKAYLSLNVFERLEGDYPELTYLTINDCSHLTSLKIKSLRKIEISYSYCPRLKHIAVFGPMCVLHSFNDRSVVSVTGNCVVANGRKIDSFLHDSGTCEAIKVLPFPIYEEIVEYIIEFNGSS